MRATTDGKARYGGRTLAEWVPAIVDDLVREFDPLRIVLFGSVARGDDGPDSDVDLLVELDTVPIEQKLELVAAIRAAITAPVPVDVLVVDRNELTERGDLPGVLRVALREGEVARARPG